MFRIDPETLEAWHTRGDNASVTLVFDGVTLTENDRVVFGIKGADGLDKLVKAFTPNTDTAIVTMGNSDTEKLLPGDYWWNIRIVRDAIIGDNGLPVDGTVITPYEMKPYHLLDVAGEV